MASRHRSQAAARDACRPVWQKWAHAGRVSAQPVNFVGEAFAVIAPSWYAAVK